MYDHVLHSSFDQWLATSAANGKSNIRVLSGQYAKARMRYIDGAVHIAVLTVKRNRQRQGIWTRFLEHCEKTGRTVVVESVEDELFATVHGASARLRQGRHWRFWALLSSTSSVKWMFGIDRIAIDANV
jgi:hypothetical protein